MSEHVTPLSPAPDTLWFYADAKNETLGPMPFAALEHLAATGVIQPSTHVIERGGSEWKPFSVVAAHPADLESNPPPASTKGDAKPKGIPARIGAFFTNRQRRLPVFLTLIFTYPIGLFLLWRNDAFARRGKIIASVIFGFVFIGILVQPKPHSAGSAEATPSKGSKRIGIGEKFRLGDFTYQINFSETRTSIGPSFARVAASGNGVFVIVHYSITNESDKTRTVLSDDFVLRDSKGRTFRPSSKALAALAMTSTEKDLLLSELQPGLERETATAFEVSDDSELVLIVPEKGLFGSKRVEVRLD